MRFDCDHNLINVNFSNFSRDMFLGADVTQVRPFYVAMKKYEEIMRSDKFLIRNRMKEGKSTPPPSLFPPLSPFTLTVIPFRSVIPGP